MSEPVALISSSEIQKDEFISFLQELGASTIEDPKSAFDARLSKEWQHVWIALDPETLESCKVDEPDLIETFEQMLNGKPNTYITLEISREVGSQQLAIGLACKFAERWPCIVDNYMGKIFSSQELLDLQSSGGNLW